MDELNDDIILMIFEFLDNDSMLNFIKASNRFSTIFSISPKLQRIFNLLLNEKSIFNKSTLPPVPFRNVTISDINIDSNYGLILNFIASFKNTIEILNLKNIIFNNLKEFCELISGLSNLTTIKLQKCYLNDEESESIPIVTPVKCVSFEKSSSVLYSPFHHQKSIEKISIDYGSWQDFNALAATLPNLNHIITNGTSSARYFNCKHFPFKIQKMEAYLMTSDWTQTVPRLNFLKSQLGHLKELTIHKLPYDYDGGEMLKFIIEEMGLEKFYFGKISLILNGKKQDLKEFTAWEVNISCAFEMFRQFPYVQSFTLFLTHTGINKHVIKQMIDPPIGIFRNLKNLDVLDHSGSKKLFSIFLSLYKNCRNITRLSFRTDDDNINSVLRDCLSSMTYLREIYIRSNAPNSIERLQIIQNQAPNVKKLSVVKEFIDEAKEFFGNEMEVMEAVN